MQKCFIVPQQLSAKVELDYSKKPNKLDSLTNLFLSENFTINLLLFYLGKSNSNSITDFLVNLLSSKQYKYESYFYLPQICSILVNKSYTEPIEDFILNQCVNHIKFSLSVFWLISSFAEENINDFSTYFLPTIEMTLVNGRKYNQNNISKNKINNNFKSDQEIYNYNILKQFRFGYFNQCIKFYKDLKLLCEHLKNQLKEQRNTILKGWVNSINRKIANLCTSEKEIEKADKEIRGMYRGIILPFDDSETISNSNCNVIINILPENSFCISTKARVPVRLLFECASVKDCGDWDNYVTPFISQGSIDKEFCSVEDFLENFENNEQQEKEENTVDIKRMDSIGNLNCDIGNPFGEPWSNLIEKIKRRSIYRNIPSYKIKSFIAKSNDDLRQEALTMQILKMFDKIFKENQLPLKIKIYEIIITSINSGLIEYIPNTISFDLLKKKIGQTADINIFFRIFFNENFEEAQKNFAESLAGYSLVTYILNIKDRHNGNILLDMNGNIIHIDFGFILGISPGNMNFETAPFKLTKDYLDILDGENSNIFQYFKTLLIRGFIALKRNFESILGILEIMAKSMFFIL